MIFSKWKKILAAALALSVGAAPVVARADTLTGVLLFYGAIKLSESQAIKATANYYEAIGMSAKAQKYTRLAADLQNGSLGGADGVKTIVQCSKSVESDIAELQAAGVYPTQRQKELVKKAKEQLVVAKVALAAAVVIGTKTVVDSESNMFVKLAMAGVVAAESAKVISAITRVHDVAKSYNGYQLGGSNGFQVASKEALPQFADL
ncbi:MULTISPECIES: hypothetical protein [unclassified Novosphingobium]|uniref:hypothetical protein n=1 Tax=unclassified Novosphingobium TaxID=2644732 RepID=UPI00086DA466|nr:MULTISPECIES: hypothetical protein [unclassified Novosphingobium]MBN9146505.1 hypothetical protein [Novosphingobium sp.]MDR6710304.1 hypothetical protein [Novosphingobium sp. 1748]ODU78103.1 MAG: hypothetical protein ABT10_23270 [Novosphingobium sp. SCN 63-17]OJX91023.1 MAG: hypothetical protein BGP00_07335 [Novosphingobium sp. 63-713]